MSLTGPNQTSFKKGELQPKGSGRPKGAKNKLTREIKIGFLAAFSKIETSGKFEEWLYLAAEGGIVQRLNPDGTYTACIIDPDPLGAVKAVISMADFVFPRINRTEVTGKDGAALLSVFKIEEP
jgi:hypothetical protein